MNYCKYIPIDVINGRGTRCTLFVAGCIHHCKGCYNQSTWNPNSGSLFTKVMEDQIINDLLSTRIPLKGLSLSGGDPLLPTNIPSILALVKRVKSETKKDIWLWTGYSVEELKPDQLEVLKYVDVVVDGKYDESLSRPKVPFRGSTNQEIIQLTPGSVPNALPDTQYIDLYTVAKLNLGHVNSYSKLITPLNY